MGGLIGDLLWCGVGALCEWAWAEFVSLSCVRLLFPLSPFTPLTDHITMSHTHTPTSHRLASAACVPDFSIADLVYPEPERTRLILSAIINFIKFAEENEAFLKGLQQQAIGMVEERDGLGGRGAEVGERVGGIL